MHRRGLHQRAPDGPAPAIWLLSGTGDGPVLAEALLQRGWHLLVSVVSAEAMRAYPPHPRLTVRSGPLADAGAVEAVLDQLRPRWVVDATHPFALQVSAQLQMVCERRHQPGLALARAAVGTAGPLPPERVVRIPDPTGLRQLDLRGVNLLLAIGSRQLPQVLAASSAARHYARVLDRPISLQLALAAGLPDDHLACLRPDPRGTGALERALCRRWQIGAVLCRESGGEGEALWHRLCAELGLRLILVERPVTAPGLEALPLQALLEKLGAP
ncbi:MAG: hypothetical protein RLZZ219_654 [Cyanobacteriota bacterium]|jgi:precorrin-6A/cobalt-precorrin-6A reductase